MQLSFYITYILLLVFLILTVLTNNCSGAPVMPSINIITKESVNENTTESNLNTSTITTMSSISISSTPTVSGTSSTSSTSTALISTSHSKIWFEPLIFIGVFGILLMIVIAKLR